MSYANLLLVDRSVPDYQVFLDSVNETTCAVLYSPTTTSDELNEMIRAKTNAVERIGFVFRKQDLLFGKPFLESKDYLVSLISELNTKNIDFLACNTLNDPLWKEMYDQLEKTGVVVGASSDLTGNLKYGGNWVMESTSQDIEHIYFTNTIEYYKYLLDIGRHIFCVKQDGLYAKGINEHGELGPLGTNFTTLTKIDFVNYKLIKMISSGDDHIMILLTDGRLFGAGHNGYGQLGNNTFENKIGFGTVPITTGVDKVYCGTKQTMIIKGTQLFATGNNSSSMFGKSDIDMSVNLNQFTPLIDNVIEVSCGYDHVMIIRQNLTTNVNEIWGAGSNQNGRLGLSSNTGIVYTFRYIENGDGATQVKCGSEYTMILKGNQLFATGRNVYGQLGNNTYDDTYGFGSIPIRSDVSELECENNTTMILVGNDLYGSGLTANGIVFTPITNATGIIQLFCSGNNVCILKSTGLYQSYTYNGFLPTVQPIMTDVLFIHKRLLNVLFLGDFIIPTTEFVIDLDTVKPQSDSDGAFFYTSSDPSVASISGTTLTINKLGTVTITARQIASGIYPEVSTNYTLNTLPLFAIYNTVVTSSTFDVSTLPTLSDTSYTTLVIPENDDGLFKVVQNNVNPFIFGGVSYTDLYVGANGSIQFSNFDIGFNPLTENPKSPGIYPFFKDLFTLSPEYIKYKVVGDTFIVVFRTSVRSQTTTTDITIRVTLHLKNSADNGKIVIEYGNMIFTDSFQAGISYGNNITSFSVDDFFQNNTLTLNTPVFKTYSINPSNKKIVITPFKKIPTIGTFDFKYVADVTPIANPPSNSSGEFYYTSSNTAIATITRDNVTKVSSVNFVSKGDVTLTAMQVPSGNYGYGFSRYVLSSTPTIGVFYVDEPTTTPFTITNPTSNSNGVFAYQTNSALANIEGNTVTLLGKGPFTITGTQEVSKYYNAGTFSYTVNNRIQYPVVDTDIYNTVVTNNTLNMSEVTNDTSYTTLTQIDNQLIKVVQNGVSPFINNPFIFGGLDYTDIYIGENGSIQFSNNNLGYLALTAIPPPGIYPFFKDLKTNPPNYIKYKVAGDTFIVVFRTSLDTQEKTTDVPIRVTLHLKNSFSKGKIIIEYGDLITNGSFQAGISYGNLNTSTSFSEDNFFNNNRLTYNSPVFKTYSINPSNKKIEITPIKPFPDIIGTFNVSLTPGSRYITLSPPNSTGVFTYTSSDPSVASIVGTTLTINKSGLVNIIATQSPTDLYGVRVIQSVLDTSPLFHLYNSVFTSNTLDVSSVSGDTSYTTLVIPGNDDGLFKVVQNGVNPFINNPFIFGGVSYTDLYVGANGSIQFSNFDIGFNSLTENPKSPGIYPFFKDLFTLSPEYIKYKVVGDTFIVVFRNSQQGSGSSTDITIRVTLHLKNSADNGKIIIEYGNMIFTGSFQAGISYGSYNTTPSLTLNDFFQNNTLSLNVPVFRTYTISSSTITNKKIEITPIKPFPTTGTFNVIVTDSRFITLSPPTSSGNFTYTSSDPNVASIVGDVLTINNSDSVVITAKESSDDLYTIAYNTVLYTPPLFPIYNTLVTNNSLDVSAVSNDTTYTTFIGDEGLNRVTINGVSPFIGNPFIFGGITYKDIYVGLNGSIQFSNALMATSLITIPTSPGIYPFLKDLNTISPEYIKYKVEGNTFIVVFRNSEFGSSPKSDITVRVTLHLKNSADNGKIIIEYGDIFFKSSVLFSAGISYGSYNNTLSFTQDDFFQDNRLFLRTPVFKSYTINPSNKKIVITPVQTFPKVDPFVFTYNSGITTIPTITSESDGTFTYLSSNTAGATVSGNNVSFVGKSATNLTATQFPSGNYGFGLTQYVINPTPTIGLFTPPILASGDTSFTITDPTSTSGGAFTYTISDPSIATVKGKEVTILKKGNGPFTITGSQAATTYYNIGTTSYVINNRAPENAQSIYNTVVTTGTLDLSTVSSDYTTYPITFSLVRVSNNGVSPFLNNPFIFGGITYTEIYVGSNGTIQFSNSLMSTALSTIPTSPGIYPFLAPLSATPPRYIKYKVEGNTFIVVFRTSGNTSEINVRVILHLKNSVTPGRIIIEYGDMVVTTLFYAGISYGSHNNTSSFTVDDFFQDNTLILRTPVFKSYTINPSNKKIVITPLKEFPKVDPLFFKYNTGVTAITDPTSESLGSFTYLSSNSLGATVSGRNVSFVNKINTSLTAIQAPAGNFGYGLTQYLINPTPTIGLFTPPILASGDTSFTITDPTSTSGSAFTYTSSDTSIATVDVKNVTILKKGNGPFTITGTQAATTYYNIGTTSYVINNRAPENAQAIYNTVVTTGTLDLSAVSSDYTFIGNDGLFKVSINGVSPFLNNPFIFGGITYTDIYVGSNGSIQFSNAVMSTGVSTIPTSPGIYPFFKNLFTASPEYIKYKVEGNTFIVVFRTSQSLSSDTDISMRVTMHLKDSVTPGRIIIEYGDMIFTVPFLAGISYGSYNNTSSFTMDDFFQDNTLILRTPVFKSYTINPSNKKIVITPLKEFPKVDPLFFKYNTGVTAITDPTSNSGGTFTYVTSNTAGATVSGNNVSFVGKTSTNLTAIQAPSGNFGYGLTEYIINPTPTIGVFIPPTLASGVTSFTITDPTSTSGGAFTYRSSDPAIATVNAKEVTILKKGAFTISGDQAESTHYTGLLSACSYAVNNRAQYSAVNEDIYNTVFSNSTFVVSDLIGYTTLTGDDTLIRVTSNGVSPFINNPFIFGGVTYTDIYIGLNGSIQFSNVNLGFNALTSNPTSPGIYPFFKDLDTVSPEYIKYKVEGDTFIVVFRNSEYTAAYTDTDITVRVTMHLNDSVESGKVMIEYGNMNFTGSFQAGISYGSYNTTTSFALDDFFQNNKLTFNAPVFKTYSINPSNKKIEITPILPTTLTFAPTVNASRTIPLEATSSRINDSTPISYSIVTHTCNIAPTISGSVLTINSEGSITLKATQNATNLYYAGENVYIIPLSQIQSLFLSPNLRNCTITIDENSTSRVFTILPVTDSGGAITYASRDPVTNVDSLVATFNNNVLTLLKRGTTRITVTQAAFGLYVEQIVPYLLDTSPLFPVTTLSGFSIPITSSTNYIKLTPPTSNRAGDFTYTSSNPNIVLMVGGSYLLVNKSGTVTITATQAASGLYESTSIPATFNTAELSFISDICFPAGTPVETDQGIIEIDKLKDETIDGKRIVYVTRTQSADTHLVCIEKDALGKNVPCQNTVMTQEHCVEKDGVMVRAAELVNGSSVYKQKYHGEKLYNVLMEELYKMKVNNMVCETLDPENPVAKIYKDFKE